MALPTALWFSLTVILAITALLLAVRLRGYKAHVEATEQQLERSQDEIWELKSAAAALDKAEAASEAKSRFLATVSHEFRTPLNGILGLAELLASTPLNAEQTSYLSAIRASGEALSSLINEILDFSRIDAGKVELKQAEFDLPALVEGIVELLSPRAQGKGMEICSIVDKDLPRIIIGDSGRLRQVLLNLAGNAVKFTETGGVAVEVRPGADGMLRFSVFDTGPGVNQARRTTIFHDFELGDASSTRRHEGTGLGLAISRRIVEHMGGKLWLEQSGPEGSQFCFEIPLQRAASAIARESGPHLLDRRILIVGDSPFGCGYLARRLSNLGARTNIARDQEQAASILKSGTFALDFLIVDCSLGEKAIDELSKAARTFPDCKSVLLFSPFERRAFGDSMLKSFDGWLVKPVRMESIGTKLVYCTSPRDPETGRLAVERPEPDLTGKRFLLAEDNDVNALLVEMQLRKLGAIVRRANDGREAVMLVEDSFSGAIPTFHAVLMDLRMPNLDGLAATKEIRAIERSQNRKPLSIVALTADAFEDDREAALSAGMQTFLTKPVDLSTLVQVLSDLDVQH